MSIKFDFRTKLLIIVFTMSLVAMLTSDILIYTLLGLLSVYLIIQGFGKQTIKYIVICCIFIALRFVSRGEGITILMPEMFLFMVLRILMMLMADIKETQTVIQFKDVSFQYAGAETESVHHINLDIKEGEFIVLTGASGCGKTTLTRIVNGLAEQFYEGKLRGNVTLLGQKISQYPLYEIGKKVGSIFQDPKSQFFASITEDEVAFGCENYGVSFEKLNPNAASLAITSSSDFLPRFLTFIISPSDLLAKSSTVLIPARFKQLNERTDKSSSSIVSSKTLSFLSSLFSTIISLCLISSVKSMNKLIWSLRIFALSDSASSGVIVPSDQSSKESLS